MHVASTTDRIHDRAAELGPASFGVVGDLTVESDVDRLLAAVGHVDVLVNNAGMVSIGAPDQVGPVTTTSYAEWRADLARNLDTAFLVTRRFLPAMVAAGWGRVVNIGSIASLTGGPYIAAYTAAKHGLLGLTRALAAEWVRAGITVNLVAPGYVDTAMTDATVENIARRTGRAEAESRAVVEAFSPQRRLVAVEEIVPLVRLLVGDEAASITGAVLPIDGGASAFPAKG